MHKLISLWAMTILLVSCSTTDLFKVAAKAVTGAQDAGGISTDLQVGGKRTNQYDISGKKDSHSISNVNAQSVTLQDEKVTSKIQNAEKVTINNNNPWTMWWLIVIGLIGWILPQPSVVWAHIKAYSKKFKLPKVTLPGIFKSSLKSK